MLDNLQEDVHKVIYHLQWEFAKLQVWRANPAVVEDIMVPAYGSHWPLRNIASVTNLDPQTLSIQPWDKSLIRDIDKAIADAHLWLNPQNNWETLLIKIQTPTEEWRRDLTKRASTIAETSKISLRSIRQDYKKKIDHAKSEKTISEDIAKDYESDLQKQIDEWVKHIDTLTKEKESEIMKI